MTNTALGDSAALLQALIQCDSVTPNDGGALDVLNEQLEKAGFAVSRLNFEGDGSYPVGNLFATAGSGGRHILFCGHTDVVPPGNMDLWTFPPFSGHVEDGVMYGRGAVDMKSGVAAFAIAAAAVATKLAPGQGRISLAITGDEEADAINGTVKMIDWAIGQGEKFDFAIVGEPSSRVEFGDSIKIGRRGSLSGIVTIRGKQGHSAYPERTLNPVAIAAALAVRLGDHEFDRGSDHFQPTNLEVTSIDVGNKATNVIPAEAKLAFNVRFNDHWTAETLTRQIDDLISSVDHRGCTVTWRRVATVANSFVSDVSDDVELVCDAIEDRTGQRPDLATFGGTSDARFIAPLCPVIECGLVGQSMHQVDEHVPVAQVEELTGLYRDILMRFFGIAEA
ncbi:MAG: succinyl-diaminopimelate desuccinylase [Hyphomicrobiaceae bacterium]|nr:succinyl-diaminopimelate desuccinylase [Hyphomicrobiaceae bacterium]MCC0022674.1 succinyl-diaminopimelate desuccinylase [Hyphomicrobiaceae bacterium]